MEETCAYCKFHIWADHLSFHICQKKDDHKKQPIDDNCKQWKDVGKYQNISN